MLLSLSTKQKGCLILIDFGTLVNNKKLTVKKLNNPESKTITNQNKKVVLFCDFHSGNQSKLIISLATRYSAKKVCLNENLRG